MAKKINTLSASMLATAGILAVGYLDFITGIEIRIFPLYFLPLMFAAWYLGKIGSLALAVLAAFVWMASMYFGGREYSHSYVWAVNFITQGTTFVIFAVLFSHIKSLLAREMASSRTDGLTGLNNSRSFYEQTSLLLRLLQRKKRPVTLAYIDLDNFKNANDTLGHIYGDELLRKVAEVFRSNFRSSDLVARMGGDEFAVLLPETAANDAGTALEKIRAQLAVTPQFKACAVTASIGAVAYAQAPADIEPMIKAADQVMYRVKNTSKNQVLVETIESG